MGVDVADRVERMAAKTREAAERMSRTFEYVAEQLETSAVLADRHSERDARAGRSGSAAKERLAGSHAREAARRARVRADHWRHYRPEIPLFGAARRLDVRERAADRRDRLADMRESIANDRELLADYREQVADTRERHAHERPEPQEFENARRERAKQAAARQRAARERAQAAKGRAVAAAERNAAREQPPD